MNRITALIAIICFLLILVGCEETVSTPTQKSESTEAPLSTPSPAQVPATEMKPTSEAESTQTETTVETSLAQTTTPESDSNPNTNIESVEPVLLDTLRRNCQITQGSGNFDETGLAVGGTAVNFTLKDINGSEFRLSQLLAEKPVMMVFGSFT